MSPSATLLAELPRAVREAAARIRPLVRRTEVERAPFLEQPADERVWLKMESLQYTGSFKLRGAANRILALDEASRRRGVVAASSGNHGKAVAHAAAALGCPAIVYVPHHAATTKVAAMRASGAEVRVEGHDSLLAEKAARAFAAASGRTYVSPYNDPLVIAGQGTLGLELAEQLPSLDAVFVAIGGGGLISGVGAALRQVWPEIAIVACSPENSAVLHASLEAGEILDQESLPTLSDGTAGGLEAGSITFELCRQLIDESVLVSEEEIRETLRAFHRETGRVIEGAAAVAVAGFAKSAARSRTRHSAIVICGGNVDPEVVAAVLGGD